MPRLLDRRRFDAADLWALAAFVYLVWYAVA